MKKDFLPRRDSIILTAIDIMNELGVCELSIREIAKRQNVTDASLYRHFKSKQEIILAVLDYYAGYDPMIANTVQNNRLKPKEGILFAISFLVEYYENYPAITAVTYSCEMLQHDPLIGSKMREILNKRLQFISKLIRKGQELGEIDQTCDSDVFSEILIGTVRIIILKWRMENYRFSLNERVSHAIKMLL